jgi:hypothetical protein
MKPKHLSFDWAPCFNATCRGFTIKRMLSRYEGDQLATFMNCCSKVGMSQLEEVDIITHMHLQVTCRLCFAISTDFCCP